MNQQVQIVYTNWKGATASRTIEPIELWFGKTTYHPVEQWLLRARDAQKDELRDFAMQDIQEWRAL